MLLLRFATGWFLKRTTSMSKVGLAFSGGGVRSAAFCSGVLRRLLQRNAKLDYLSCVSGGGYTGCAYMDWKFRHGKKDSNEWHSKFFDHLRSRSGIFCDWQRPLQGLLDSIILTLLPVFVSLVVPLFLWAAYACPLAYVVDFCAGDVMRGGVIRKCDSTILKLNETVQECDERREQKAIERFFLFSVPLFVAFFSYVLVSLFPKFKNTLTFFSTSCGAIFGLLFLPWFFHDVLEFIPTWMKLLIIFPTIVLWFAFPVMRTNATLVVIVYLYSFVVMWRVYRDSSFVPYSDNLFVMLLWLSGLLLFISPLIGTMQQRLGHIYNRYVL